MEEHVIPDSPSHTVIIHRRRQTVQFVYTTGRNVLATYTFEHMKEIRKRSGADPYWDFVMGLIDAHLNLIINTN